MIAKKKNPYQHLLEEIQHFCVKLVNLQTLSMWQYPKGKLDQPGGWGLLGLWDRTAAASQLGYEVVLVAHEDGLLVKYRKRVPEVPFSWR